MRWSITCLNFIRNIRFKLRCRNTWRASRSVCLRAQISHPHKIKLQGIAQNMRYLKYTSTWLLSQKDSVAPIEAFAEEIRLTTSGSSCSEKETQEPKYLKWEQKVTLPSATTICFVYVSEIYKLSSRLHFFSFDSPLTCLDLRMHNVFSPLISHDTIFFWF